MPSSPRRSRSAQESPIVVAPPLRGTWIAGDSVNNGKDAAHRRAILVIDGKPWIAQRYAIDWVQVETVDGKVTTWKGPEDKNASYFCYDQPIYQRRRRDGRRRERRHGGEHAPFRNPRRADHLRQRRRQSRGRSDRPESLRLLRPHAPRHGAGESRRERACRRPHRPCRQHRQLGGAASAFPHRRPAVVPGRRRRPVRVHQGARERPGRSRRRLARSGHLRRDRAAKAVRRRLPGRERARDVQ